MAIDLSALTSFTTSAGALSNLILVNPQKKIGYQPQSIPNKDGSVPPPPPKFLFHYEGENIVTLESDITDHYVEDNTAINDQIALSPEKITVEGFIGELNNVVPEELDLIKFAAEKLLTIGAYTPELTITALNAYNSAFQAYNAAQIVVDSAVSAWNSISGSGGLTQLDGTETPEELAQIARNNKNQTEQQLAFQLFYGYWRNRTLFTVQTPWAVFKNMAIESVRAIQNSDTETITSFEINFKIIRFANTITQAQVTGLQSDNTYFQGRAFDQGSSEVDLGTSNPIESLPLSSFIA